MIHKPVNSLFVTTTDEIPKTVVAMICEVLRERNIKLYAIIDHQTDMQNLQVYSYPAYTIIFGNPAVGSKLLKKSPHITVDIPLRIAVMKEEAHEGSTIIFRDMTKLFSDYLEVDDELRCFSENINNLLSDLITQSVQNKMEEYKWRNTNECKSND